MPIVHAIGYHGCPNGLWRGSPLNSRRFSSTPFVCGFLYNTSMFCCSERRKDETMDKFSKIMSLESILNDLSLMAEAWRLPNGSRINTYIRPHVEPLLDYHKSRIPGRRRNHDNYSDLSRHSKWQWTSETRDVSFIVKVGVIYSFGMLMPQSEPCQSYWKEPADEATISIALHINI